MSAAYVRQRLAEFCTESIICGIDPDLHATALCWWKVGRETPLRLEIFRVAKNIKGQDCAALMAWQFDYGFCRANLALIEGQRFRKAKGHETKNAQSLIDLATITGVFAGRPEFGETLIVEPSTWKGSVPKAIHQARILGAIPGTKFKATKTYCYPTAGPLLALGKAAGIKRSDWKHVVDAIGIAAWAIKKIQEREKRERLTRGNRSGELPGILYT